MVKGRKAGCWRKARTEVGPCALLFDLITKIKYSMSGGDRDGDGDRHGRKGKKKRKERNE